MELGPVEYAVVEFPGSHFHGEVMPELADLARKGVIRVLDLTFVRRNEDGSVAHMELNALAPEEAAPFEAIEGEVHDLLNAADIELVAAGLSPGSSAVLLVWENLWAKRLTEAARRADGRLLVHERVPHEVARAAFEALTP
ncbi:hypothetical protein GCM10020367_52380 [Streptomyces sannanensis]|uniref:DUF1269 domain-containing protein n=1 Tax=Streptomyces sannanensis TaxID=285536 RepID=A0ABP6SIK2_9ACTN